MAESGYQSVYKQFFLEFAATVNPDDQLPVKVAGYCICDYELQGEIVDWILQYLSQKRCPSSLIAPLAKIVVFEIKQAIKRQAEDCGYQRENNAYQPLKLMQVVTAKVNEVCLRYIDEETIAALPPPLTELPTSVCSIKNTRRRMEDRHTVIDDFHSVFGVKDDSRATYYGVFDGHAGTDAAVYGVSHLHQYLAESKFYPSEPERALKDAFLRTDELFLEKSNRDNLRSGTTALCALLLHDKRKLYLGWLGDSQAIVVRRGVATQLVNPHKPSRLDERKRIEDMGGCVMFWGMWRVNGQLAVSRAIGDLEYKPYVSAEADVLAIPLEDDQDFIVLACDGLWDFVSEQQAAVCVYETIREHPGDLEAVSASLVRLSKTQGSVDNISVIVVFLTDPATLASLDVWPSPDPIAEIMEPSIENGCPRPVTPDQRTNGQHNQTNGAADLAYQKASFQLDLDLDGVKCKAASTTSDVDFLDRPPADGKEDTSYDDDDFGPETDVDAVDDVLLSPAIAAAAKAAAATATISSISPKEQHLAEIEADLELQRQQLSVFDPVSEPREETPTPPADDVTGGAALEPEADNVAESGDESEDEWNYYRADPSEKKPAESVAAVAAQPEPAEDEDEDSMESRLNPNAAEFVPSPTSMMPSLEEVLSASPLKGKVTPMDNVFVPSASEFKREFSKRPSELHEMGNPFAAHNDAPFDVPDFVNGGQNGNAAAEILYQASEKEPEFGDFVAQLNSFKHTEHLFDKSEVSSTLAEYGDDTSSSLATNMSACDEKVFGGDLNASMTESDFLTAGGGFDKPADVNTMDFGNTLSAGLTQVDQFSHNTLDLSTEMQMESSTQDMFGDQDDFQSNLNPFFVPEVETEEPVAEDHNNSHFSEMLDSSPVLCPVPTADFSPVKTPEEAIYKNFDFQSPDTAPGNETVESPDVQGTCEASLLHTISGFEELSLDPVSSSEHAFQPELPVPSPRYEPVSPVHVQPASSELNFDDFEQIQPKPEIYQAPEQTLQAVHEDFPNVVPTPLTNGFNSEADAKPDVVAESVIADIEHKPVEPSADAVGVSEDGAKALAATAAVATVAAVATGAVIAAKKTDAKKPAAADKTKPAPKTLVGARAPAKTAVKSNPVSPTKPIALPLAGPRLSSTPKKPLAATPTASRPAGRVAATTAAAPKAAAKTTPSTPTAVAARVKPTTTLAAKPAATKPAPAKTAVSSPRPRTTITAKTTAVPERKPLVNGDAKPAAKRPEPLATKRIVPTTATTKPLVRPATAPLASTKTTKTTTTTTRTMLTSAAAKPAPKTAVTNGVSKPRPATSVSATRVKAAVPAAKAGLVDKQGKETANKQLSQTVGSKMSTVTRTTATTTTRKMAGGATKTSTVTTATAKSTGPIRRPPGTVVTKTTTTTTKTEDAPLNDAVEIAEATTTTIMKDESPIIIDNNVSVVIGTD